MKIGAVFASLFIVGGGQFIRGRLRRGAIFVALDVSALIGLVVSVFVARGLLLAMGVHFALRLISAADAAIGPDGPRRLSHATLAWLLCGLGVFPIATALSLRAFVVEAFKIPSGSMIPTLQAGDHIFVDKRGYTPERGDVVVFRSPADRSKDFLKRIIGVAGDTIEMRGHALVINGTTVPSRAVDGECIYDDFFEEAGNWQKRNCTAVEETLADHHYRVIYTISEPHSYGPFTVPPDHVFVIGDNRDNSHDSRFFGNVPVGDIKGRALSVWLSFGPHGLRRERLGLHIH